MKTALIILLAVAIILIVVLIILILKKKNTVKKEIMLRFALIYILIVVLFGGVIYKIILVQYTEGEELRALADRQVSDIIRIAPNRGRILAADGRLLTSSLPSYYLYLDLDAQSLQQLYERKPDEFLKEMKELSEAMSKKFQDKTAKQYEAYYLNAFKNQNLRNRRTFPLYDKPISFIDLMEMRNFPVLKRGEGRVYSVKKRVMRVKPYGELASRTIGDVFGEEDKGGRSGLEKQFDEYLKGKDGWKFRKKMAGKFPDIVLSEPSDGLDIISTIDIDMQDIVDRELRKELIRIGADLGTAIVMEVKTGEIKAISNLTKVGEDRYREITNIAVADQVEPGSTFKTLALMIALEDGLVDTTAIVHTGNGIRQFSRRNMRDWNANKGGFGTMTMPQILHQSSNVGVSSIIYDNYGNNPQKFIDGLLKTKIHTVDNMGIPGSGRMVVKKPDGKGWSNTTLPWMSIGYEVQIPPIYTLMYYNAFANNGKMMKPIFAKEVRKDGVTISQFDPIIVNPAICSPSTLGKIRAMLEGVVTKGTAKNIRTPLFSIAGKTGTAQIAIDGKYKDASGKARHQVSFCGYFPADNPMYSIIVYIKNPTKANASAGGMSGMVFKNIAEKIYIMQLGDRPKEKPLALSYKYDIKGYTPDIVNVLKKVPNNNIKIENKQVSWVMPTYNDSTQITSLIPMQTEKFVMPDLMGMGAKDALFKLENMGMEVIIDGFGKVAHQSVAPLSEIELGSKIALSLK